MTELEELRKSYHQNIKLKIIRKTVGKSGHSYYNMADGTNKSSVEISDQLVAHWDYPSEDNEVSGQTSGDLFEKLTQEYIGNSFNLLNHIRPGKWIYSTTHTDISNFDQYEHLGELEKIVQTNITLATIMGSEYIIKPDIIVAREPMTDEEINNSQQLIDSNIANYSPLRGKNSKHPILHASISCKWTIRSDRSQNTRTEALNLIRNRKGNVPHIVSVTAEPLPTRIATLALGTGDLDCVYHFALVELIEAVKTADKPDQMDILMTMINGRRLRDISDLPLDLAI
jgi:hypothetical protein